LFNTATRFSYKYALCVTVELKAQYLKNHYWLALL
jgi:hypothetical protein